MKSIFLTLFSVLAYQFVQGQSTKLDWAKSFGGTNETKLKSLLVCKNNSLITVGSFKGTTDFDPNSSIYNLTAVKYLSNIFICKINADGNFNWAKNIEVENLEDAKIDDSGNILIIGSYKGIVDFDPGPDVFNLVTTSESDIYLAKLDSNGNFLWAKSFGGKGNDLGIGMCIKNNSIFITGSIVDTVQFDPFNLSSKFERIGLNTFALKLDKSGNFEWGYCTKGFKNFFSMPTTIRVDNKGNIVISGSLNGKLNFNSNDTLKIDNTFEYDIFAIKLSENGAFINKVIFSSEETISDTHVPRFDYNFTMFIDSEDNIYLQSVNVQEMDADPGSAVYNLEPSSYHIIKKDSNFKFVWANVLNSLHYPSGSIIYPNGFAKDKDDNIYLLGSFKGKMNLKNFSSLDNLISNGENDIFIFKLNQVGELVNAVKIGNEKNEMGLGLVIDNSGSIIIAGSFIGIINFNPQWGFTNNLNSVSSSYSDMYLAKYSDFPTSIKNQINSHNSVELFPNPNSGTLIVEMGDKNIDKIEIYSMLGILVVEADKIEKQTNFDISHLAPGVYIIKLFEKDQLLQTEKLLKK